MPYLVCKSAVERSIAANYKQGVDHEKDQTVNILIGLSTQLKMRFPGLFTYSSTECSTFGGTGN